MKHSIVDLLTGKPDSDLKMGLAIMGPRPESYVLELLEAISISDDRRRQFLVDFCQSQFPFLFDTYSETGRVAAGRRFDVGGDMYEKETVFLQGVENWLDGRKTDPSRCFYVLAGHKALYGEYEALIEPRWGNEGLRSFRHDTHARKDAAERQLCLVPTYKCNLDCDYCLSSQMPKKDVSLKNILFFLKWSQAANVKRIRLYGGEPTHYTHFPDLVSLVQASGMKLYFASNLIFPRETLRAIDPKTVELITAHIRSPSIAGDLQKTFWLNAKKLRDRRIKLMFRYNVMDEDWQFIVERLQQLKVNEISFANVVEPGAPVDLNAEKWLEKAKIAGRFANVMLSNGITPLIAKPLPLCLVDRAGFKDLWHVFRGHCGVHLVDYTWNTLIRPDMSLALCDGDFLQNRPFLWEFENWEKLTAYVAPRMKAWQETLFKPICETCYFRFRALCQGFCLAMKGANS